MSKNLLTYCVIHVTDTPFDREVTKDDIFFWHCFPKLNSNGTVTYLGKTYPNKQSLPDEYFVINKQKLSIRNYTNGRGWSVVGYADLIPKSGELINLNPYNSDEFVDKFEVTNGVAGINSRAKHVTCAGGWTKDGRKSGIFDVKEVLNPPQIDGLISYMRMIKEIHPTIIFKGHHEFDKGKTCPNFDVQKFIKDYNIF